MNRILNAADVTEKLIMKPFNGTFLLVFAVHLLILIVLSLIFRKKSEQTRRTVIAAVYILGLVIFIVYKIFLSRDTAYSVICAEAGKGEFSWWLELPFQLCNINLLLIPIAVLTMKRPLLSFAFFLAPLGAGFALAMPGIGFEKYSLLTPRIFFYYVTHFMVFFGGPMLACFGLYKPRFRDTVPTVLMMLAITFAVFLLNELLIVTKANEYANYFFTNNPEGNAILELCWSLIPAPFLYELPLMLILVPFVLIVTAGFWIVEKVKNKPE